MNVALPDGRVYYYHVPTNHTQWNRPSENMDSAAKLASLLKQRTGFFFFFFFFSDILTDLDKS